MTNENLWLFSGLNLKWGEHLKRENYNLPLITLLTFLELTIHVKIYKMCGGNCEPFPMPLMVATGLVGALLKIR